MLELVKTAQGGLVTADILEDLLFPPIKAKPQFKGGVPLPPADFSLVDCSESTVFTLLFGEWKERKQRFWTFVNLLIKRSPDLADADLFARNIHGECALSLLADAARKIETLPSQPSWQKTYNEKQMKLPQQLLQAWQAARTPAVRSVQPAFFRDARARSSAAS